MQTGRSTVWANVTQKSGLVNTNSVWNIPSGKHRLDFPLLPEIFRWNDPKSRVPFTFQPDFPENFVNSVNGKQPRFPAIIFSHPTFSTVDYSSDIFTCFKVINAFKRQNSWNEPFQKRSTYFRLGIPRMVCGFVSNITV